VTRPGIRDAIHRPLIAIPARFSENASALRHRAEVGSRNLISAVYAAGGEPLLVHPSAPGGTVHDDEVAERISWADGVLLPGGGDLAAHWFGEEPHPSLYDVDDEQDVFDLAVARVTLAAGRPLLAICRGLQVVNVALGGTLIQDMDGVGAGKTPGSGLGHHHHRHRVHTVGVEAGTRTAEVVGGAIESSCYHHQCLGVLGEGMVVTARSEDGVIEGVEIPGAKGWFLGVQWHPEDTWKDHANQLAIFGAFVDAARGTSQHELRNPQST
jgi:putative glutamine amidotransferase